MGGMLFQLLNLLVNILCHFGFYKAPRKMRMDPVIVALAFHRVPEIDWSFPGDSDESVSYAFATCTVQDF